MTPGFWRRKLAHRHIVSLKGDQRAMSRHWGVIATVDPTTSTLTAYLDGSEQAVGPIPYNGSVPPPNVGETWAFDVVQNSWVAAHGSSASDGTVTGVSFPSYADTAAVLAAQAAAFAHSDAKIDACFNLSGSISGTSTPSDCGPYFVHATATAGLIFLEAGLGTADSGSHDMTVTYYLNGAFAPTPFDASSVIGSLVIPSGTLLAATQVDIENFGSQGDQIQCAVTTYAGSTAAALVAHLRAF